MRCIRSNFITQHIPHQYVGLVYGEVPLSEVAACAKGVRIPLSACGYIQSYVPGEDEPMGFKYWVWGAAVAEVEVNICTGEYQFLHASVCQDVGKSLNSALDIGQCEGAFIQALSWVTRENILYDPKTGDMLNHVPENYFIATHQDIPREFNVKVTFLIPKSLSFSLFQVLSNILTLVLFASSSSSFLQLKTQQSQFQRRYLIYESNILCGDFCMFE